MVLVLVLLVVGVVPIWQYVDARCVPDGAELRPATVVGHDRGTSRRSGRRTNRGEIVRVELADDTQDTLYLDWRLNYPDEGDTLQVFTDADGDLASPTQGSLAGALFGAGFLVVLPTLVLAYLRSKRRARRAA